MRIALLKDPILIILFIILTIFLFKGLGNGCLWQDEAETAVLARNTLKFGFPKAFDGINLLNPYIYTGFGKNYQWLYHPWLQFYIVASFFALFGQSTIIARLPFALLGLFSLPLTYILTLRLFSRKDVARTASLLLTFSVSYLLLMRQCRYYALAVFFSLCVLLVYLDFIQKKRFSLLKLFLALVLLFYSVHGVFIPLVLFLVIHYLSFHYNTGQSRKLIVFLAVLGVCTLPWFLYSHSFNHEAPITIHRLRQNFEFQARVLNKYIIPAGFFALLYVIYALRKRRFGFDMNKQDSYAIKFILILTAVSMAFFCTVEQRTIRYLVYLFPVLYLLTAYLICRWQERHRLIASLFLVLLIATGIFNSFKFRPYIFNFIYEITHPYHGPLEGMVAFLKSNAKPGDTVKTPYDEASLIFYCPDLKIDNSVYLENQTYPEWIIFRDFWSGGKETLNTPYFKKIQATYKRYDIEAPDIIWQNRPDDLEYHKFKSVPCDGNKIIIFGKR